VACVAALLAGGCGSSGTKYTDEQLAAGSGGRAPGAGGKPAAGAAGKAQAGAEALAGGAGGAGAGAGGDAAPDAGQVELIPESGEVCDGMDNDKNGLVDDADVEGDGVCDCLKIASIGRRGAFGDGELAFRDWPNAKAQNHVVPLGGAELTDERLAPYDVLIVLNVSTVSAVAMDTPQRAFSDAEVAAFERFVRGGGGVITTAGYSADQAADVANVNKLLAPFGLGYSSTKIGLDGMISSWTPHPLTEGIERVFTEVGAEPDGAQALSLAKDAKDHVALQVPKTDGPRVLVWGDEWITYASQWRSKTDQQVERFWLNSLGWLSRPTSCQHVLKKP
jgi:hypothetical protein